MLTDGGYSNAEEIARCEGEHIEVAAPIRRGAMNSDHFHPPHSSMTRRATLSADRLRRRRVRQGSTPATERSGIERLHAAAAL